MASHHEALVVWRVCTDLPAAGVSFAFALCSSLWRDPGLERRTMEMRHLEATDPEIAEIIKREERRQFEGIELIASENYVSTAVAETMANMMTNKYAEGLPGKRYYAGCEFVDQAEMLAIERAKQLFG
ncbi:MAG TPA: hypothetical protein VF510_18515, partial [Ktedonobacterales bacterium]